MREKKEKKRLLHSFVPHDKVLKDHLGANVLAENGIIGFIHRGQKKDGEYYIYPFKNSIRPFLGEYKILSYFS